MRLITKEQAKTASFEKALKSEAKIGIRKMVYFTKVQGVERLFHSIYSIQLMWEPQI